MTPATSAKRAQVARFVEAKLAPEPAVQALFVVGSVAMGTARDDSDVDAFIFFDPHDLYFVPAESIWREADDTFHRHDSGVDGLYTDLHRLDLAEWRTREWPEPMRAALDASWIAFDRNGEVAALVGVQTRYSDDVRQQRLDIAILELFEVLDLGRPERTWQMLGDVVAHDRLTAAYDHLLQAVFAYNRTWRTWRTREMTALRQLPWLPDGIERAAIPEPDYQRRVHAMRDLQTRVIDRLRSDGVYGDDPLREAFVRIREEPGVHWNLDAWNARRR